MSQIAKLKKSYAQGEIPKSEFIDKMYSFHKLLEEYSNELKNTEIEKIEIIDGKILMLSRKTAFHVGSYKFLCDLTDKRTVTLEAFNFNTYEKEDSEMIFKLLNPEFEIFDIGANIGWYSVHMAAFLKKGTVHCFEPIPETFEKLNFNVRINNIRNIKLNPIALSEKKQILKFYYSPQQTGAASSQNITDNELAIELTIDSLSLNDYIKDSKISKLDFIKCDVEGAELFVFQGAMESLEKFKPIVFTEMLRKWAAKFGYHPNDILKIFHDLGYRSFYSHNSILKEIIAVDEYTTATNFFMLHPSKHSTYIAELCREN